MQRRHPRVAEPHDVRALDAEVVEQRADLLHPRRDRHRVLERLVALVDQDAMGRGERAQLARVDDLEPADDRDEDDRLALSAVEHPRAAAADHRRSVAVLDVALVGEELGVAHRRRAIAGGRVTARAGAAREQRGGHRGREQDRGSRAPGELARPHPPQRARRSPIEPVPTKLPWRRATRATSPGRFHAPPRQTQLSALQS